MTKPLNVKKVVMPKLAQTRQPYSSQAGCSAAKGASVCATTTSHAATPRSPVKLGTSRRFSTRQTYTHSLPTGKSGAQANRAPVSETSILRRTQHHRLASAAELPNRRSSRMHWRRRARLFGFDDFAENYVGVTLGPPFKFGDTLEACLFIQCRRLEVIARYPNLANASTSRFRDEGIQQCTRVTTFSMCLINPHLLELRSACPRIAGNDADHLSHIIANYKAQTLAVIASCCTGIVVVEAIFNCVDLIRREVMPGFYLNGHTVDPRS